MGQQNDPYKLNWRFWSRYLSRMLLITALISALFVYLFEEPFSFGSLVASFLFYSLMWLGPELSTHYHKTPEQLRK